MKTPSRHLYLRVWLAAVLALALVMVLAGIAWHIQQRDRDRERSSGPIMSRMLIVRNTDGDVLAVAPQLPRRGQGYEFQVVMPNGQEFYLQVPRTTPGGPPPSRALPPWWARSPYGFLWTLLLVGMVVALALYPVIRRLTVQLERLQNGVQRWGEGDLNVRFPVQGQDEVADLSRRFNEAADRIQNLMSSQKSLLANASHELRSPLARIRMAMELMESPQLHDDVRQRTRAEVLRNMAELDQLIDEILLASRLDAKEADMGTIEPVELVGLCAEECARVGASLDVPEGQFHFEVQGVSKLLRRLVRNLLDHGAPVEGVDDSLNTPLHVAAFLGHADMVRDLLARGASRSRRNRSGQTPLDVATSALDPGTVSFAKAVGRSVGVDIDTDTLRASRPKVVALLRQAPR